MLDTVPSARALIQWDSNIDKYLIAAQILRTKGVEIRIWPKNEQREQERSDKPDMFAMYGKRRLANVYSVSHSATPGKLHQ
jgi:hypothetical protein